MEDDRRRKLLEFLSSSPLGIRTPPPPALERYNNAFTHRSYLKDTYIAPPRSTFHEEDSERLEFLGDRVLNMIVADILYQHSKDTEGEMSARMEFIRNTNLGILIPALVDGFLEIIRVGENQKKTPRLIAGIVEAFIGALYLDIGFDETRAILCRLLSDEILRFPTGKNYKKTLQESLQMQKKPLPFYELVEKTGEDHLPLFVFQVRLEGIIYGKGVGRTKADATQRAAYETLKILQGRT